MKKIASLVTMGLLVGGLTFADDAVKPGIKFGAWSRAIVAPIVSQQDTDGTGVSAGAGTSWSTAPRVGFNLSAATDDVGFVVTLDADNQSVGVSDNEEVWAKPFPGFKVQAGCAYNDTLAGFVDFGSWDWIRTDGIGDRWVFSRIGEGNPVNGIFSYDAGGVFAYFELSTPKNTFHSDWNRLDSVYNVLNDSSFGAGYTIDGVGQVRAQYVGYCDAGSIKTSSVVTGYTTTTDTALDGTTKSTTSATNVTYTSGYGIFQAAFRLTGVKGLYADIGVWAPVNGYSDALDTNNPQQLAGYKVKVPVYIKYTLDKATIHGIFQYINVWAEQGADDAAAMVGGLGLDYDFGNTLGLTSDVRVYNQAYSHDGYQFSGASDQANASCLIGLVKNFTNGNIGVGFQYTSTSFSEQYTTQTANWGHWAVPVKVECSF